MPLISSPITTKYAMQFVSPLACLFHCIKCVNKKRNFKCVLYLKEYVAPSSLLPSSSPKNRYFLKNNCLVRSQNTQCPSIWPRHDLTHCLEFFNDLKKDARIRKKPFKAPPNMKSICPFNPTKVRTLILTPHVIAVYCTVKTPRLLFQAYDPNYLVMMINIMAQNLVWSIFCQPTLADSPIPTKEKLPPIILKSREFPDIFSVRKVKPNSQAPNCRGTSPLFLL